MKGIKYEVPKNNKPPHHPPPTPLHFPPLHSVIYISSFDYVSDFELYVFTVWNGKFL